MADASIYRQFLQPVRSVQDYAADMDQADLRRVALEGARRQNALQALTANQQVEERNALARLAQANRGNQEAFMGALEGSGMPGLMAQGQAMRKQRLEQQTAEAQAKKSGAEAERIQYELGRAKQFEVIQRLGSFSQPEQVAEYLQAADGVDQGTRDVLLRTLPRDAASLQQWQVRAILGLAAPKDQAEALTPKVAMTNAGGAFVPTNTNALAGPVGQVKGAAPIPITQSADNKATVGASLANAAALRDAAKLQADATRAAAATKRDQDTEMKLADDYRAQSKEFAAAKSAHEQLTATLGSATTSPAATLAAATKFMKILDPGSVVRESELGMALAASGVIDRAMNYISTLQSGQKLTPTQAADFKKISGDMFQAAQRVQQQIDKDYQGKAKAYGLRPEMVTQDLGQNANVVSWGDLR